MGSTVLPILEAMSGYAAKAIAGQQGSAARPARLATISVSYTSGNPQVTFDGEDSMSGKGYPVLSTYNPTAGDRVLMLPVGNTYVVVGAIQSDPVSPHWRIVGNDGGATSFTSPWRNFGASFKSLAYRKYWKDDGYWVDVIGVIDTSAGVTGSPAITTLPEGFRPDKQVDVSVTRDGGTSSGAVGGILTVATTGIVSLANSGLGVSTDVGVMGFEFSYPLVSG
jgi:hypothetical protein